MVHPEGRLLAVHGGDRNNLALVDLATGWEMRRQPINGAALNCQPSGALLTYGPSGLLRWPMQIEHGPLERYRITPSQRLLSGGPRDWWDASADGQTIAIPNYGQGAVVLHRGPPQRMIHLQPQQDVRHCAVSPDGRWVATGSHSNTDGFGAKVWEAATGRLVKALPVPGLCSVFFSPDGRWLLTNAGGCRLWNVGIWTEGPTVGGPNACFSSDSRLLAVEDTPGAIRLVSTDNGKLVVRLESPQ
jgi:WD40 repeat protein